MALHALEPVLVLSIVAPTYIEQVSAQWLTTRQVAQMLGVTPSRVRQFIIEGRLEAQKIGRDLLVSPSDLEVFAARARERTGRPRTKSSL